MSAITLTMENRKLGPFGSDTIRIGRNGGNDIVIPEPEVSHQHCVVYKDSGDVFLEDLGSKHGTYLNGRRLEQGQKIKIRIGDIILVPSKYEFAYSGVSGRIET